MVVKSKEQYVKFSDRNTQFFLTQTLCEKERNEVYALNLPYRTWCDDEEVLKNIETRRSKVL